jgi:glycosyltransferase involved in cell wall biosynthesis
MPNGQPWPKISIVTPSYNQGQFIEETIRSVLLQGYPDLEYIIMDGGSTDGSVEIIRKYESWLTYWVSEPDRGQSDAINKGLDKSTGEIMAWLNSDDTYRPNALARAVSYFVENPECDILYGEAWHTNEDGYRLRPCRYVIDPIPRWYIMNIDPIVQPATFWRKGLWFTLGKLDSKLIWGFDWDFYIRAHLHTKLHYIPEFLANFRLHNMMKTNTGGAKRHAEVAKITRRYGGWWQPTNIYYQAARPRYLMKSLTSKWPERIRKPLVLFSAAPLFVLGRLFAGKFMS